MSDTTPAPSADPRTGQQDGLSQAELDELVAAADTGARNPAGPVGMLLMLTALAWALFQLWFASPIPFIVGWGVFNDTEARSIHLAFAIFLGGPAALFWMWMTAFIGMCTKFAEVTISHHYRRTDAE
ncbi:MAG: alanine:cation symporter family protein, partial [Pseudomonadota bacterium]